MKALIFCLLLLPSLSWAGWNNWTQEQKNWYVASNLALVADWATTRNMTRRYDEGYYERNIILGKQPSTQKLDLYFITYLVSHYFVTDYFKNENRILYLQMVTAVESAAVANNLSIGLKIRF